MKPNESGAIRIYAKKINNEITLRIIRDFIIALIMNLPNLSLKQTSVLKYKISSKQEFLRKLVIN